MKHRLALEGALFLCLLGAVLATHVLALEIRSINEASAEVFGHHDSLEPIFRLLVLGVFVVVMAIGVHELRRKEAGPTKHGITACVREVGMVLLATLTVVVAVLMGEGLHDYLRNQSVPFLPLWCIATVSALAPFIERLRRKTELFRTLEGGDGPPRKVLIFMASPPFYPIQSEQTKEAEAFLAEWFSPNFSRSSLTEVERKTLKCVLNEDAPAEAESLRPFRHYCSNVLAPKGQWNTWQILRAIHPHCKDGTLKHLVIVGSKGNGGSFAKLGIITKAVIACFGDDAFTIWWAPKDSPKNSKLLEVTKEILEKGPQDNGELDFERIGDVTQTLYAIIREFRRGIRTGPDEKKRRRTKYAVRDIVIDTTGGKKPVSVAGALATLSEKDLGFQYVQTSSTDETDKDKDLEVVSYNVVLADRLSLEL